MTSLKNNKEAPRFFCDLDHTLIYSHRVALDCKKQVVEMLNGNAQSFMTERTYSFLNKQSVVQIIPTTTRSVRQYERLSFFKDCQYALTCNGGLLLINGKIDEEWHAESLELISSATCELEKAKSVIHKLGTSTEIHNVHDLFFYIKCDSPAKLVAHLDKEIPQNYISLLFDAHKVYCLPNGLTKGAAVQRFIKRFGVTKTLAAGDSAFDISMLNAVDLALYPKSIKNPILAKKQVLISTTILSDGICDYLESLQKEIKND